jgi:glycosyltransferase involved in cell wall biosynthesis
MNYPRITIVTPSFNQGDLLEETIKSVISQDYPNLEYIIIDGGSTDNAVSVIKKYEKHLAYWVSEKDQGLYHALEKGFSRSTGEIMGWINSDDLLHRNSLFVLANIFRNNPHISWLQGHPSMYDESGMVVDVHDAVYSKYHFYLKKYTNGRFIQQESTYWRRSLWEQAGSAISTSYRFAGDFELWIRFFQYELLHYTNALVGGYRVRAVQISRSYLDEYMAECNAIVDKVKLTAEEARTIKSLRYHELPIMRKRFVGGLLRRLNKTISLYQEPVRFDFQTGKFYQGKLP